VIKNAEILVLKYRISQAQKGLPHLANITPTQAVHARYLAALAIMYLAGDSQIARLVKFRRTISQYVCQRVLELLNKDHGLKTFKLIKDVSDTVFDMINAVHDTAVQR